MDLGIDGKVAMVGGASKGLGFSVARMLAAEGVNISIASRDEGRISEAARQLEGEYGVQVLHQALDLRSNDGITAWRDATLERFTIGYAPNTWDALTKRQRSKGR